MSFNYGEIHMFESVRKDMEAPNNKCSKTNEAQANNKFPFAAPINGRRHTVANLWAPFPDDKGNHVGKNTTVNNPPPPSTTPPFPGTRRPSVVERMRQYMSPDG
eukprot:Phypoly_transcript_22421.p2 GENE.Phypoly_transcript_22421~~Phypoly_transcript_22421.p2  ORF type:complete len:104 (-),score=17.12 Phypoly_transcript_22421:112-423(-)